MEHAPFEPFRVRLSNGTACEVHDPGFAVVMRSRLLVADPDGDRYSLIPCLHIAAVETVGNGASR